MVSFLRNVVLVLQKWSCLPASPARSVRPFRRDASSCLSGGGAGSLSDVGGGGGGGVGGGGGDEVSRHNSSKKKRSARKPSGERVSRCSQVLYASAAPLTARSVYMHCTLLLKKVKVAHTRLPSVGFRS